MARSKFSLRRDECNACRPTKPVKRTRVPWGNQTVAGRHRSKTAPGETVCKIFKSAC